MFCVSHAFESVHCCLVVTCWERVDFLAPDGDVYCIFVSFPCGILCQVWFLVASFPDLCRLAYFAMAIFLIFWPVCLAEQAGMKLTLSETPKTGFLATRPIFRSCYDNNNFCTEITAATHTKA